MLRRTFSVAQANALIPWLQEQFTHTRRLTKDLLALRASAKTEHAQSLQGEARPVRSPSEEYLAQMSSIESEIKARIEEAVALGIEVRRVDGLVDFPAWIEGQMGFLCWRYGEEKIGFWHPSNQGFDGRRPLTQT